jgi:DNA-nicking Smr family endonuclease
MGMDEKEDFLEDQRAVILPIEDSLDLHTFLPKEVRLVVEEYLFQCAQKGFKEVRIIHGRGQGVQRALVHSILLKNPHVLRFKDAPAESGGWGVTMVSLKQEGVVREE